MTRIIAPALPAESRHLALRCRDRAALLRKADEISKSRPGQRQVSEGTAKLLEEAAEEISRLSGVYISAVRGRQEFREALTEARRTIKALHGPVAWDIYEAGAPEMKRIDAAILMASAESIP